MRGGSSSARRIEMPPPLLSCSSTSGHNEKKKSSYAFLPTLGIQMVGVLIPAIRLRIHACLWADARVSRTRDYDV